MTFLAVPIAPESPCGSSPQPIGRPSRRRTGPLRRGRPVTLRRSFISLTLADGARRDVLERSTHQALATRAIDLYTTLPWEVPCAEILKLDLPLTAQDGRAQSGHSQGTVRFMGLILWVI